MNYEFLFYFFCGKLKMNIQAQKKEISIPQSERAKEEKKPRTPPKTCPVKPSLWFVTINSNVFINDKPEHEVVALKEKFGNVIEELLANFDEVLEMKTSGQGINFGYAAADTKEILCKRVSETKCQYVLEVSPSGKLHAHIMFLIRRRGIDIKINMPLLKQTVDKKMGCGSCYCNYKLHHIMTTTLEDYMRKNPVD
jgi:hypothetical protein